MPRISLLNLDDKEKGLWVSGPRDKTPEGHLRRNRGVNLLREREVRSRTGTTADAAVAAAHSLTKFDDVRFQGATTVLYKNAVSIDTGYDGTPLTFQSSEPRTGTDAEYLFVSGGGKLTKVDTSGTVTQWGIDPPAAGSWGASVGGNEEADDAVTVFDPQETTVVATNTTTGWISFGDKRSGLTLVQGKENPSGIMVCQTAVDQGTEEQES